MQKLTLRGGTELELSELKPSHGEQGQGQNVSLRCPHCGSIGVLTPAAHGTTGGSPYAFTYQKEGRNFGASLWLGVRFCPNMACGAPVFVVAQDGAALISFPPATIEFNTTNLPVLVRDSLSEAIRCHANGCYRAAALLVRRTLEEVCSDKSASGKNLQERIRKLRDKVTLPEALFTAMDTLRLLGNDAAHVEAKTYDTVGQAEIEAAIALAKEIVKAAYQYEDLLQQLRDLQRGA